VAPLLDSDCAVARGDYEFTAPEHSVVSNFDLVCEAAFYVPLLGTTFFLGFLIGVTVLGARADSHGRRSAYLWSLFLLQVGALAAVCAPTYSVYAAARFLTGFGTGGIGMCTYVWNAEVLGPTMRSTLVISSNTGFALGIMLLSPLSSLLPSWRALSALLFALGLPYFAIYKLLLESPAWLASKGRADDVYRVLSRVAAVNGHRALPRPRLREDSKGERRESSEVSTLEMIRQLTLDPRLSRRFHVMCFTWFSVSLGYYGISMNVSHLGGSIYLASALSAFVELPAYLVGAWTVEKAWAGRRATTGAGLVLGGLCCVLCMAAVGPEGEGPGVALLALVYTGKFAVALGFASLYLYAAELVPTDMRSRSMGMQSLAARLGGMLAPIVADLGKSSQALPLLLFGVPCTVAGLLLAGLPETRGQPMASSVNEVPAPGGWPCFLLCTRRYQELDEDSRTSKNQPAPATVGNTL